MELTSQNINLLLKNEIISLCDRISVVKIIPSIKEEKFKKGDIIYSNNSKAENYYILTEGKVRLSYTRKTFDIEKGNFGSELKRYQSTAAALTDINVIVIHKSILLDLIINNNKVKNAMFKSIKSRFETIPKETHEKKKNQSCLKSLVGSLQLLFLYSSCFSDIILK